MCAQVSNSERNSLTPCRCVAVASYASAIRGHCRSLRLVSAFVPAKMHETTLICVAANKRQERTLEKQLLNKPLAAACASFAVVAVAAQYWLAVPRMTCRSAWVDAVAASVALTGAGAGAGQCAATE